MLVHASGLLDADARSTPSLMPLTRQAYSKLVRTSLGVCSTSLMPHVQHVPRRVPHVHDAMIRRMMP